MWFFFFQAEDGIRDLVRSRGLGDVYKRQIQHIVARDYAIDERMTLEVTVSDGGQVRTTTWALNEVSIEKAARERMLEVIVEIDGRPLSTWGCDGVIIATPTGSTAYALALIHISEPTRPY